MLFPGLCRICLLALTHLLAHTFESCCYCHIQPSNICFVCLKVVGESEETPAQFNSDHDLLSSFFPHSNADISRPSWEIVGATWSLPLPPAASLCNPAWGLVLALPTSPTNSTTTTVNFLLGCSNHRVTTCSVHWHVSDYNADAYCNDRKNWNIGCKQEKIEKKGGWRGCSPGMQSLAEDWARRLHIARPTCATNSQPCFLAYRKSRCKVVRQTQVDMLVWWILAQNIHPRHILWHIADAVEDFWQDGQWPPAIHPRAINALAATYRCGEKNCGHSFYTHVGRLHTTRCGQARIGEVHCAWDIEVGVFSHVSPKWCSQSFLTFIFY